MTELGDSDLIQCFKELLYNELLSSEVYCKVVLTTRLCNDSRTCLSINVPYNNTSEMGECDHVDSALG